MTDLERQPTIEELLDRAVQAINRGDRATANELAEQVLAVDRGNPEAEDLLLAPAGGGELRRLTIMFADVVDSTALSTRIEPEIYRTVIGRYREHVNDIVNRYEGHIFSTKGDGLLAVFGHPRAHEDDVRRAVQTGLDITREVVRLSERVRSRFGFDISVRVGVHRGLVYLDTTQDDVYGLGANLAARMCGLAEPGTVAVSEPIARLVHEAFELEERPARSVKGVEEPIVHYRVLGEREITSSARGPLVGRQRELTYLQQAWRQATAGTLATPGILLLGEGGIGKSRLAHSLVEMAQRDGAPVLDMYGSPFHTNVGLRPVRRLLERRCRIRRESDPAERLARLRTEVEELSLDPAAAIPLLAPVLGIAPESGYQAVQLDGRRLYEQIGTAIHDYVLACLGTGPGLLVVEDMHWFDTDTVEVVRSLLHEGTGRLAVIMTARQLASVPDNTHRFELKPLSDNEADKLIVALDPDITPDAQTTVRRRCDGVPLYIEEVLAKLREQPSDAATSAQVPDTLYEALFARLRSSASAVVVVEAAALIGSLFDRHLLSSVVELDDQDVEHVLSELARGRVLERVGKHNWRFHHELLREVAAELSPPSVRRRLHGSIADALVAAAGDANPEWQLVAHHYQSAERFDRAAYAYQQASADARRRGALAEARSHLSCALKNIARLPTGRARDRHEVAIRLESGFLASAAGGHSSAEAAGEFERCLHLIGEDPSPQLYATFSALWSYYTARGYLRRAAQLMETLRGNLGNTPAWYQIAIEAVLGVLAALRGEFHSARVILEQAAAAFVSADAPDISKEWLAPNDPFAGMLWFLAFTRFVQGDLTGAEEALEQSKRRCETLGFPHGPFSLCYGRSIEGFIRTEAGQAERAAELLDDLEARAQQYGFDEWLIVAASERAAAGGLIALAAGEIAPAALQPHIDAVTAVVQTWRAYEMKSFLTWYDSLLARLLTAAGRPQAARERVEIALQTADDSEMHFFDPELLRARAHTYSDASARTADLRAAVDLAHRQGATIFELRAAVDDFVSRGEPARAALAEAVSHFPGGQNWQELNRARTLLG